MVIPLHPQITKHVNDIIQKYASSLFRNATLEVYGIKTAPIKELINPELPIVEVSGGEADMVFLLEDDTYLHLAFVTGHDSKKAMLKCVGYDTRLYERDERLIHTVVIYTADVKTKPDLLNIGTLTYDPNVIPMANYDGNTIFTDIETKIKSGQDLVDADVLKLVLLPLMSHTMPRYELASNVIELAKTILDTPKRDACIAAAFAFASKYLDDENLKNLREVLEMTALVTEIVVDRVMDEKMEIARSMLKDRVSIDFVSRHTGLDESTVREIQDKMNNEG